MATKKVAPEKDVLKSIDASLKDLNEFLQGEFFEKMESIDWKLWEIYNIVKTYVEANPNGTSAPAVSQPQPSTADIAAEVAKALSSGGTEEKKSVVGKLFGK